MQLHESKTPRASKSFFSHNMYMQCTICFNFMFDSPEATATRTHRDEFSPQAKVQWWYLPWNVVKLALRPEVKEKPWIKYATKQSGTLEPSNKRNQNIAVKREEFRSSSCHPSFSSEPLYRYWFWRFRSRKKSCLTIYKSFWTFDRLLFLLLEPSLGSQQNGKVSKRSTVKEPVVAYFQKELFCSYCSLHTWVGFCLIKGEKTHRTIEGPAQVID